jgi:hypothetical protein
MARKRAYDVLGCFELTQGDNPIPASEVRRMGISRAAQVARLEPTDRTPEIRKAAVTRSVLEVRNQVQQKLNAKLPPTEHKPILSLLAINLPEDYVTEFEELIELLGHTDGARDGDSTQSIRAKPFKLMLIGANEYWAQEIAAVMRQMKAEAATHDSPASQSQEDPDFPDEEEFADVPKPRERQQPLLLSVRSN